MHPLDRPVGRADAVLLLEGLAGGHRSADGLVVGRAVVRQDGPAQRADVGASLLRRQPEQRQQAGAEVGEAPAAIQLAHQAEHRPRDRRGHVQQQGLAVAQGVLRLLQGGDVVVRHHDARGLAADDAREARQKPLRSVDRATGVFGLERVALASQHGAQLRRDLGRLRAARRQRPRRLRSLLAHGQVAAADTGARRWHAIALAEFAPGAVDSQQHAMLVEHADMRRQAVQHRLQELLRRLHRPLDLGALRDVHHVDQPLRSAVGPGHAHRLRQHAQGPPVAAAHLELAVQRLPAHQKGLVAGQRLGLLRRWKHPGEPAAGQVIGGVAVQGAIRRVHPPVQAVGVDHRHAHRGAVDDLVDQA